MKTTSELDEQIFRRMKEAKEYFDLGGFFWDRFVRYKKGTQKRQVIEKLWDSLTKEEQHLCDLTGTVTPVDEIPSVMLTFLGRG